MDWKPEPQSLLIVTAGISFGIPTRKPTCLAKYIASEELCNRRKRKRIASINLGNQEEGQNILKRPQSLNNYKQCGSKLQHNTYRYNVFYTVSVNDLNIYCNLVDWFLNKLSMRNSYIKSLGEYRIL